jgi:hypothetical protein
MFSLSNTLWNTEFWSARFLMCQLNPNKPFDLGFAGAYHSWIFLTSASLDLLLLKLPAAQMSAVDPGVWAHPRAPLGMFRPPG